MSKFYFKIRNFILLNITDFKKWVWTTTNRIFSSQTGVIHNQTLAIKQFASTKNQPISSMYLDLHRPFSSNARDQTNCFDKYCNSNVTVHRSTVPITISKNPVNYKKKFRQNRFSEWANWLTQNNLVSSQNENNAIAS